MATTAGYRVEASVSDPRPPAQGTVTIIGRLLDENGRGVAGASMVATWHEGTTTAACSGSPSDSSGTVRCSTTIGGASPGVAVTVDVSFTVHGRTVTAQTSFTPR